VGAATIASTAAKENTLPRITIGNLLNTALNFPVDVRNDPWAASGLIGCGSFFRNSLVHYEGT